MPGFDQPFTEYHNFGAYMDTVLMGKINNGGWVAINIIPTAGHTIWGVLAGKLLISSIPASKKISYLMAAGIIGLVLGFGIDAANITPIIKRISTSTFVLASGGWVLLFMAFLYWLVDIKQVNKLAWIFTVVGMNAIFIYLFFETVGWKWLNDVVAIFVKGGLNGLGVTGAIAALICAVVTLISEWALCYWLSRNKIFIKI
jgi:predicted acyltransferase